jgi:hypothetical protein
MAYPLLCFNLKFYPGPLQVLLDSLDEAGRGGERDMPVIPDIPTII